MPKLEARPHGICPVCRAYCLLDAGDRVPWHKPRKDGELGMFVCVGTGQPAKDVRKEDR